MPQTNVNAPDGSVIKVNHPEGATQEQILAFAKQQYSAPQPKPSFAGSGPGGLPGILEGVKAAADIGATMGRGMLGTGAAAIGGLLDLENQGGGPMFDAIQSNPVFNRPLKTQEGQAVMNRISPTLEKIELGITDAFGAVPGGPVPQTMARTGVQGGLELLGIGALGRAAKSLPKAPPGAIIPEVNDLFSVGRVAFNEARIAGGGVRPESLSRAAEKIRNISNDIGLRIDFDPDIHGPAYAAKQRIVTELESGNIDFDKLLTLRELAGDVAGNADPAISMRGMRLKNSIDDFVDSLGPEDVTSGNPEKAAQALASARKFWRDASVARAIEKEIELAGNRAGQFSGSGYENALRTQFRQLNARIIKGHERGFTPEEIAAIKKVADGGPLDNVLRFVGKLAPTGVVSGGIGAGAGFALAGPAGAVALPTMGGLARTLATRGTISNAQNALNIPLRSSLIPSLPK